MQNSTTQTTCCIVGGGPAGMMLGLLFARAGVQVTVLEQHADFFRDFRGDTIHPSTLQLMTELGILTEFLNLPHQKTYQLRGYIEEHPITIADFSKLKVQCPYIAFMPQWHFLDFLKQQAQRYANFNLIMSCDAYALIKSQEHVRGVKAKTATTELEIYADLVVAADGRHSTMRQCSGLSVTDIGAPMDVLWFRLTRQDNDPPETFGKFIAGKIIIAIDRAEYWQCGYVIPKGDAAVLQQQDIQIFRGKVSTALPFFSNRVQELKTWEDVKLLTVKIDRLKQWYLPGLLCIGDAAHAMSPVGGVGINLAIQDAVATANILTNPLLRKNLTVQDLAAVQKRREFPVKVIQKIQMLIQSRVIFKVLHKDKPIQIPWLIRQIQKLPVTRNFIGKLIGIGVCPEHIANAKH